VAPLAVPDAAGDAADRIEGVAPVGAADLTPVRAFIGISGWRYAGWRGGFYPKGLQQRRELEYASERFDSVEINGSFYSLQRPESYERWRDETPEGFVFAVKGGRYITHMLRMQNARAALANFFASGVLALGDKLGPVLWQLPERVKFDAEVLDAFFTLMPRTTGEALALAHEHDAKVEGRSWLGDVVDRPLRHALEPRHPTFDSDECAEVLARHDVGMVIADSAGKWPMISRVTTDLVYIRLHGSEELYVSGYSPEELATWAARCRAWLAEGRNVYVYFDNDAKVHAPYDAMSLRALLDA
jgi:uncharacterized protein YecE (DUF72 family)